MWCIGRIIILLCVVFAGVSPGLRAQAPEQSKIDFSGYVKYLQTVNYQHFNDDWIVQDLFHNRLNFSWFPNDHFTAVFQARNRLTYGDFFDLFPGYSDLIGSDDGLVDLSFNIADGKSYLLNSTIDRLYLDYNIKKWEITLGRHRINWGQNLIWNPNDVFNAYSFFDFDYEERPGTDALRVQYFASYTSSAEFVYQVADDFDRMSFVGLYRFNKWGYDFQFLGGEVRDDWVIGTGWSGDIAGAGFRGEFTWFYPSTRAGNGQLVGSVSADYTFRNGFYIHAGVLYNSAGTTGKPGMPNPAILSETSAKNLTLSRGSLFGQVSYPVTPLLGAGMATIVNPFDGSHFFGPSITVAAARNLELLFSGQFFYGSVGSEFGGIGKLWFMRLRWSFRAGQKTAEE